MRTTLRGTVIAVVLLVAIPLGRDLFADAELSTSAPAVAGLLDMLATLALAGATIALMGCVISGYRRLERLLDAATSPGGHAPDRASGSTVRHGRAFIRPTVVALVVIPLALGLAGALIDLAVVAFDHDRYACAALATLSMALTLTTPMRLTTRIADNTRRWARFTWARRTLEPSPLTLIDRGGRLFGLDAEERAIAIERHGAGLRLEFAAPFVPLGGLTVHRGPAHGETPGLLTIGDPRAKAELVASPARRALVECVLGAGGAIDEGAIGLRPPTWGPGADGVHALLALLEAARTAPPFSPAQLVAGLVDEPDPRWRLARVEQLRACAAEPALWGELLDGPPDVALAARIVVSRRPLPSADVAALLADTDGAVDVQHLARALAGIARRVGLANVEGLIALGDARVETRAELLDPVLALAGDPEPVVLRWIDALGNAELVVAAKWLSAHGSRAALPALARLGAHPSTAVVRATRRADRSIRARAFPDSAGSLTIAPMGHTGGLSLGAPAAC